jgi:hypothetical protein
MVVEWKRSCKVGSWRLYRDRPDLITRGRYYFVSEEAPHYPHPHNLWDGDWTANQDWPEDPPVLGPATEVKGRWHSGELGTQIPPPTPHGDPDCIQFGEKDPLQGAERILIAGIDARCWTQGGLPVPDQVPFLWLRDTGLRPFPGDGQFARWVDSAVVPNDCTTFSQPPVPQVATIAGRRLVFTQAGEVVGLGLPFVLARSFAFHVVSTVLSFFGGTADSVSVVGPFGAQSLCRLGQDTWTISPATGVQLVINHGLGWGGPRLFSVRCEDWGLKAHLNGVELGEMNLLPGQDFRCVFGSCAVTGAVGAFAAGLGEALVYRDWTSAAQYAADIAALKAYWGIP